MLITFHGFPCGYACNHFFSADIYRPVIYSFAVVAPITVYGSFSSTILPPLPSLLCLIVWVTPLWLARTSMRAALAYKRYNVGVRWGARSITCVAFLRL